MTKMMFAILNDGDNRLCRWLARLGRLPLKTNLMLAPETDILSSIGSPGSLYHLVIGEMNLFLSNRNLFVHSRGRVKMNSDFDGCLYLDNCKMHLIF